MTKKTFKQSKKGDTFKGIFPFEFDDKEKDGVPVIPDKIHLVPIGQWEHDLYGPIIINNADIREFIQNFNAGVRKGVFITAGHEGFEELPAVGWITEVESRDNGLWGTVAWNPNGQRSLSEREFKFFSPEMCRDYEDPETHEYYRNVLTGGALTKSPYFKELQAIVFSDKNIKNNNKQTMTKTLEEVLALEVSVLTDEDKAVLKENEATLSDEQKAKYFPKEESAEEKTAREEKEKGDANEAAGLNRDGSAKEGGEQQHSEKGFVKISASELATLKDAANKGHQAFKDLEAKELETLTVGMLFSESNKAGKFLPKSKDSLRAFMESLNKDQRTKFSALVGELEVSTKFSTIGVDNKATDGSALAEVNAKVDAKIKASEGKLKFADALKEVMAENKELEARYDSELVGVGK